MASKIYQYVFLMTGLMVLFNMAGLNTTSSAIIRELGFTLTGIQNFQNTNFYYIFAIVIFGALSVATIALGFISGGKSEVAVMAVYAAFLLFFISEMISVILIAETTWVRGVLFLFMAPLVLGYLVALIEWVRGNG